MWTLFQSLLPANSDAGGKPGPSQGPHPPPSSQPHASTSRNPNPTESGSSNADHAPNTHEIRKFLHPFQPFILRNSVRDLETHESWWVTWAAVSPGVYFGLYIFLPSPNQVGQTLNSSDALNNAGLMPGGYCSVKTKAEGFEFFHLLVQNRLIRKLRAPVS